MNLEEARCAGGLEDKTAVNLIISLARRLEIRSDRSLLDVQGQES